MLYWAPKILKLSANLTAFCRVLLRAYELLHISVYMENTAIIMLKLSGATVRTDNYVLILRNMVGMLLKELITKGEVLV